MNNKHKTFERDGQMIRICKSCKKEKPQTRKYFHYRSSRKKTYRSICRICTNAPVVETTLPDRRTCNVCNLDLPQSSFRTRKVKRARNTRKIIMDLQCKQCMGAKSKERVYAIQTEGAQACTSCKDEKGLLEFRECKHQLNGRKSICRECERVYSRNYKPKKKYTKDATFERDGEFFRICTYCRNEKPLTLDYFASDSFLGNHKFAYGCKTCAKAQWKIIRQRPSEKIRRRQYQQDNKETLYRNLKRYRATHRDEINAYQRQYRKDNPSLFKKYQEKYRDRKAASNLAYYHKVLKYRLDWLIAANIKNRLRQAIAGRYRSGSSIQLLGCSIEYVISHLESQWQEGMCWDYYGLYGWHIDHIIPCSAFDLIDPAQQRACFHYTNLQPLWAHQNLEKSDRIIW